MPLAAQVEQLLHEFRTVWWACPASAPELGRRYTPQEQSEREAQLTRFQASLRSAARERPQAAAESQAIEERITQAFRTFARAALGMEGAAIDHLLDAGLARVARDFAREARRFDPAVDGASIYQALRNVWTMNCLQLLLGLPVELTDAVFAYSMLYPYTDNYLDDPAVPGATKRAFNARFARRLAGEAVRPANEHERAIYELVGMIESQFDRTRAPGVFDSLQAIHHAQCRSVELLRRGASPYEVDVLSISFEKGGTSVVADAYLVAGALNADQAPFAFGWGAFTQLVDDLQDVEEDERDGLATLFSQTAGGWPLDGLTDRTLHFGMEVVRRMDGFDAPDAEPVKELMRASVVWLVVDAAGAARQLYTPAYVQALEPHSPFRFAFLDERRREVGDWEGSLTELVGRMGR